MITQKLKTWPLGALVVVLQPLEISDLRLRISLASTLHLNRARDHLGQRPADQLRHVEVVSNDGKDRRESEHLSEGDEGMLVPHKVAEERQPMWCEGERQERELDERQDRERGRVFQVFQELESRAASPVSSV